jgi:formamidopyrimidine-DNA glycosylase
MMAVIKIFSMPELPDLSVFAKNLNKALAGKTLRKINVYKGARINVSKSKLKSALEGEKLSKVYREGKQLYFAFGKGKLVALHLMLHGKLVWITEPKEAKYTLIEFIFDKKSIAVTDFQRKASLTLDPKESTVPDALSKKVSPGFWKEALQSKASIKNLMLDQHVVRGIGNAYADEILWRAGISPFSKAEKIPGPKIKSLASSVKKVLASAEKQIAKEEPGIIGGEVRDFLDIHNAKKKKSPSGGIIRKKAGTRKTYYTDEQELFI